jgi:hypothetical protein
MYKIIGVVKKISTTKMKVRCKNRRRCPISDLPAPARKFYEIRTTIAMNTAGDPSQALET